MQYIVYINNTEAMGPIYNVLIYRKTRKGGYVFFFLRDYYKTYSPYYSGDMCSDIF
jgi:hypothetical protein